MTDNHEEYENEVGEQWQVYIWDTGEETHSQDVCFMRQRCCPLTVTWLPQEQEDTLELQEEQEPATTSFHGWRSVVERLVTVVKSCAFCFCSFSSSLSIKQEAGEDGRGGRQEEEGERTVEIRLLSREREVVLWRGGLGGWPVWGWRAGQAGQSEQGVS